MKRGDVVIVGAGIAGLAACYELHKRGVSFTLIEAGPRTGGVVLSEQVDGFVIDAGPDSLLVQKPEAIQLCEELGLGERLVATKPPRVSFILRNGRLYPLPSASVMGIPTRIGPFVKTGLFSWPGKLRMGAELFVPPKRDDADESIGGFMTRRFGLEATTYLAEPLLAGIHAGDVDRLSIRALFPRFPQTEHQYGSLLRAFRGRLPPPASGGPFRSLPGGLSELTQSLTDALPPASLRLQAPVERVGMVAAESADSSGVGFRLELAGGDVMTAPAVIMATPAFVTARLTRDLNPELARLCAEVPYASTATVALAFEQSQVSHAMGGSGFVVPRVEQTAILATSWLSSKWPGRAPDQMVLMRTFAGGARDPHALDRSDDELVAASLRVLEPLLGITGQPLLTRVYRWNRANAQHEVGHLDRLAAIARALVKSRGLFVTGSGFRGVGIPDCVADGRATARQATNYLAQKAPVACG
jgi:oxygen-dependent protoporphyrinogen oxidase